LTLLVRDLFAVMEEGTVIQIWNKCEFLGFS